MGPSDALTVLQKSAQERFIAEHGCDQVCQPEHTQQTGTMVQMLTPSEQLLTTQFHTLHVFCLYPF